MIKKGSVVTLILICASSVTFSQNVNSGEVNSISDTTKKGAKKIEISQRYTKNTASITQESATPEINTVSTVDVSKRSNGTNLDDNSTASFPKPATRTNEVVAITSAKYTPNTSLSILDNLLEMAELKNNINDAINSAELKSTSDYTELNANITSYRTQFDSYVVTKGFENCTKREQNYYLSFLKDEDRMEEYNLCLSKIN